MSMGGKLAGLKSRPVLFYLSYASAGGQPSLLLFSFLSPISPSFLPVSGERFLGLHQIYTDFPLQVLRYPHHCQFCFRKFTRYSEREKIRITYSGG